MNNNNKICKKCGTINRETALFCKNCGKRFEESVNVNINNQDFISEQEFSAFIGKNQERFMPHFRKFFTGKKVSFSPLVFLLTLLAAPFAGGFWFLHRKMYKIGTVILAVGILMQVVAVYEAFDVMKRTYDTIMPYVTERSYNYNSGYDDDYDYYFDDNHSDNYYFNSNDLVKRVVNVCQEELARYSVINWILSLVELSGAILLGLFAKYIYFRYSVNRIMSLKKQNLSDYSLEKVANQGGTNSVPWIITLVFFVLLYFGSIMAFAINLVSSYF